MTRECDDAAMVAHVCVDHSCVYKQSTYPLHRITNLHIHQPKSIDVVFTTPRALGRWSHTINPIEYDGSKYGLLLTDDATRATTVVLLIEKSQVKVELPKHTENMQIQYGITIQAFRSDNGGEYIDKDLQAWASKKGIKWQFTVPYNPDQNGVLERANRAFEEKLQSMIIDSCVSKRLWPFGFLWSI